MSGRAARIDRAENGVELARILLIHGHRYLEPGLAMPDAAHQLEAAQVGAHQECTSTRVQLRPHEGLALDRNVEVVELFVDEINAVVDGAGEVQDMPESVAHRRTAAEREPQIAPGMPARVRREQEKIRRDPVQDRAAQGPAQSQRQERHQTQQQSTAALALAAPFGDHGLRSSGGAPTRQALRSQVRSTARRGSGSGRMCAAPRTHVQRAGESRAIRDPHDEPDRVVRGCGVFHGEGLSRTDSCREIWRWRFATASNRARGSAATTRSASSSKTAPGRIGMPGKCPANAGWSAAISSAATFIAAMSARPARGAVA